jgi:hypothetical protein
MTSRPRRGPACDRRARTGRVLRLGCVANSPRHCQTFGGMFYVPPKAAGGTIRSRRTKHEACRTPLMLEGLPDCENQAGQTRYCGCAVEGPVRCPDGFLAWTMGGCWVWWVLCGCCQGRVARRDWRAAQSGGTEVHLADRAQQATQQNQKLIPVQGHCRAGWWQVVSRNGHEANNYDCPGDGQLQSNGARQCQGIVSQETLIGGCRSCAGTLRPSQLISKSRRTRRSGVAVEPPIDNIEPSGPGSKIAQRVWRVFS